RLDRRAPEPAPRRAPPVRPREERQAQLDGQPFQRAADPRPPPRACRPERDQLVASLGGLRKAREHPAEVVADPGPRPGERRHVDGDSHRSQASILPLVPWIPPPPSRGPLFYRASRG